MAAGFLHQCTPQRMLLALSAPANLSCMDGPEKDQTPEKNKQDASITESGCCLQGWLG